MLGADVSSEVSKTGKRRHQPAHSDGRDEGPDWHRRLCWLVGLATIGNGRFSILALPDGERRYSASPVAVPPSDTAGTAMAGFGEITAGAGL